MRIRDIKTAIKTASGGPSSSPSIASPLIGAGVGALGGGALSLFGSEFIGDVDEADPDLLKIKRRQRRLKALLGGVGIGAGLGGLAGLAGGVMDTGSKTDSTAKEYAEAAGDLKNTPLFKPWFDMAAKADTPEKKIKSMYSLAVGAGLGSVGARAAHHYADAKLNQPLTFDVLNRRMSGTDRIPFTNKHIRSPISSYEYKANQNAITMFLKDKNIDLSNPVDKIRYQSEIKNLVSKIPNMDPTLKSDILTNPTGQNAATLIRATTHGNVDPNGVFTIANKSQPSMWFKRTPISKPPAGIAPVPPSTLAKVTQNVGKVFGKGVRGPALTGLAIAAGSAYGPAILDYVKSYNPFSK